jgi:putative Mg2+ transporter-C (MgtC) family protein
MTLIEFGTFVLHVGTALVMGIAIGMERQFRQHPAGLRTNALVCVGASLFVSLAGMVTNDPTATCRIAAYVVSGIGFLGGGVILREGMNVKGMNTAATLWCSAAVDTLAGAGFPLQALFGTATILLLHFALRPISRWIDRGLKTATDVEMYYQMRVVCQLAQEGIIRSILTRHVNSHTSMILQGISVEDSDRPDRAHVIANVFSLVRNDRAMQDLMSRINIEPSVISVSWEKVR